MFFVEFEVEGGPVVEPLDPAQHLFGLLEPVVLDQVPGGLVEQPVGPQQGQTEHPAHHDQDDPALRQLVGQSEHYLAEGPGGVQDVQGETLEPPAGNAGQVDVSEGFEGGEGEAQGEEPEGQLGGMQEGQGGQVAGGEEQGELDHLHRGAAGREQGGEQGRETGAQVETREGILVTRQEQRQLGAQQTVDCELQVEHSQ